MVAIDSIVAMFYLAPTILSAILLLFFYSSFLYRMSHNKSVISFCKLIMVDVNCAHFFFKCQLRCRNGDSNNTVKWSERFHGYVSTN